MYITTREMVISIICNACGVLGLILWAIEAHKSNANQRTQSVESVENNGDIIVRSNLEPFRVDEPQTEMTTEQIVNELLSMKKILDDGKMPKQRCGNCKHLTYRWNKTWCDIKCDNPHDMVCDKWERSE